MQKLNNSGRVSILMIILCIVLGAVLVVWSLKKEVSDKVIKEITEHIKKNENGTDHSVDNKSKDEGATKYSTKEMKKINSTEVSSVETTTKTGEQKEEKYRKSGKKGDELLTEKANKNTEKFEIKDRKNQNIDPLITSNIDTEKLENQSVSMIKERKKGDLKYDTKDRKRTETPEKKLMQKKQYRPEITNKDNDGSEIFIDPDLIAQRDKELQKKRLVKAKNIFKLRLEAMKLLEGN